MSLQLHSLASMAHALGRSAPLLPMLEIAAEEARATLHAASVSISRVHLNLGVVRTMINVGELGPDEVRWPEDESYAIDEFGRLGQAIHEMRTWAENVDDPACDLRERELLVRLDKGSSLATPIVVDGAAWGEFYLTRHVGAPAFDHEAQDYAKVLAAMLGAAIDRTIRETELEGVARRDPLTGLSNRRGLEQFADRLVAVDDGEGRAVTVLSADINGLKRVNDLYGHARGDELICWVARALQAAFGALPVVCVVRVGGDEFTVVVADVPLEKILPLASVVCQDSWTSEPGQGVSIGVATAEVRSGRPPSLAELSDAADRAQYVAKRSMLREVFVSQEV